MIAVPRSFAREQRMPCRQDGRATEHRGRHWSTYCATNAMGPVGYQRVNKRPRDPARGPAQARAPEVGLIGIAQVVMHTRDCLAAPLIGDMRESRDDRMSAPQQQRQGSDSNVGRCLPSCRAGVSRTLHSTGRPPCWRRRERIDGCGHRPTAAWRHKSSSGARLATWRPSPRASDGGQRSRCCDARSTSATNSSFCATTSLIT